MNSPLHLEVLQVDYTLRNAKVRITERVTLRHPHVLFSIRSGHLLSLDAKRKFRSWDIFFPN